MGRFLTYMVLIVLLMLFLAMNWSNTSRINIWFGEAGALNDVPIILSFLFVFALGVLSVLPFMIRVIGRYRKRERDHREQALKSTDTTEILHSKSKGGR